MNPQANTTDTPSSPKVVAGHWAIPSGWLNGFAQAAREENDGQPLIASGNVNGNAAVTLTLDTVPTTGAATLSGVTLTPGSGYVNWSVPLDLAAGNYTLSAAAAHPSGAYTATAVSNFTINATSQYAAQQITNTHDGGGFITQRAWLAGSTDTLVWDSAGRLLKVARRDGSNNGFDEQSIYDPLGRRIRVSYTPVTGGTGGAAETTDSWYDPQVEFLEVAAKQGGNVTWKVYGPDTNGAYGGLQGVGGLQALLDGTNAQIAAVWNDALGHVAAYSTPAGNTTVGSVNWSVRSSGYGVIPGQTLLRWSQTGGTGTTATLAASLAWQGRRIDASGYYCVGAREYNPQGGRFLSPDPLGQAASWDLYSYAGGDPINKVDCTGRSGTNKDTYDKLAPDILQEVIGGGDNASVQPTQDANATPTQPSTTSVVNQSQPKAMPQRVQVGPNNAAPATITEGPGYWDRYLQHIDTYSITLPPSVVTGAIALGTAPKSWVPWTGGRGPVLGSSNPLTSVLRLVFGSNAVTTSPLLRTGVAGVAIAGAAVGSYNFGVLVSGLVYAAFPGSNGLPSPPPPPPSPQPQEPPHP